MKKVNQVYHCRCRSAVCGWFNDVAGNMIVVLGPKWKLHEYMHLKECFVKWGQIVGHDTVIGLLGKTGNAAKTPAHMHYTILTPVPHFRLYDKVYGNGWQPGSSIGRKCFISILTNT